MAIKESPIRANLRPRERVKTRPAAPAPAPTPRRPDRTGYESEGVPLDFAAARLSDPWGKVRVVRVRPWRSRLAGALFWLGYPIALIWGIALVLWAFPGLCT